MNTREWLKSAAVAIGGGAAAALSAAAMDPSKFNLANGLKDEFFIAVQGAVIGLAALFLRSPLGSSIMAAVRDAKPPAPDKPPHGPAPPPPPAKIDKT